MQITLRDYQNDMEDGARNYMKQGYKSVLVQAVTGAGKTRIFCDIAQKAESNGKRVLILVHRKELLKSTVSALCEVGISAGQIKSGSKMTTNLVQVAMVSTLINRMHLLRRPDIILSDEAHRDKGRTRELILKKHLAGVPVIGFSATPYRLDGNGLGDVYEIMYQGPQFSWMVDNGWLCYPMTFVPDKSVTDSFKIKRGDFDTKEQEGIFSKPVIVGDVIKTYKQKADGQPAIYFCCSIAHAELMADAFRQAGYKAVCVNAKTSKEDRDNAVNNLACGEIDVITNVDVFTEGTDIPYCTTIGLLRKTMSLGLYLQACGRGSRPYWEYSEFNPNEATAEERRNYISKSIKPCFQIIDHAGNFYLHGSVLRDRQWTLEGRKKGERQKPENPTYTRCAECLAVWPGEPVKCPNCGASLVEEQHKKKGYKLPEEIEGELVEVFDNEDESQAMSRFLYQIQKLPPAIKKKRALRKSLEMADPIKIKQMCEILGYKDGFHKWAWNWAKGKKEEQITNYINSLDINNFSMENFENYLLNFKGFESFAKNMLEFVKNNN